VLIVMQPLHGIDLYLIYAEPHKALLSTAASQARLNLVLPVVALLPTVIGIWFATNRLVNTWLDALRTLAAQNYKADAGRFDRAPEEITALSSGLYVLAKAVEQRDHALNAALAAKINMTLEIEE
jgi:hypothetical protein